LARGYTLANIQELLKAIVEGHDLRSILGLESAISSPWSDEQPKHFSLLALAKLFGDPVAVLVDGVSTLTHLTVVGGAVALAVRCQKLVLA
ncbi:hypothetical protein RVY79_19785, partial [Chromohalobacter sp. HP20-39]|nr:hypothetical protein [Chromohalobacter sp. HP20-39]